MTVCVLYGGRSGEHEVSLRSAASVVKNLDKGKYRVIAIGIEPSGRWLLQKSLSMECVAGQGEVLRIAGDGKPVSAVPADGLHADGTRIEIDCAFPVLHGSFGEDGTVQGLLEIAGIPYVGAGVLGSSVSMDKETSKRLWREAGIPIVEFAVVSRESTPEEIRAAAQSIGWPLFVKPCAAGSSLGAARAANDSELSSALRDALRYDTRALLEKYMVAREIECSVVGNSRPRAFAPGEIIPSKRHLFYDYDAKYIDPDGAGLEAPANIDVSTGERIMNLAKAAYSAVHCEGMARVDFFLDRKTGAAYVNEINTIPGFTSISMFPRMCEAAGLPYARLLDDLIELALERDRERKSVRYSR
jgi:D-alanine-D-alanine ligase